MLVPLHAQTAQQELIQHQQVLLNAWAVRLEHLQLRVPHHAKRVWLEHTPLSLVSPRVLSAQQARIRLLLEQQLILLVHHARLAPFLLQVPPNAHNAQQELIPIQQEPPIALYAQLDHTPLLQVPLHASCAQWHHILISQALANAHNALLEIIRTQ